MLDMLAAIPDAAILASHVQQPPAALSAFVSILFRAGCRSNAIGGIVLEFGDKRRWSRIRGEDRQAVTGPRHRHIHHPPLFRVLERLFLGRDQGKQGVVDDLQGEACPAAGCAQKDHMIGLGALRCVDGLETDAQSREPTPQIPSIRRRTGQCRRTLPLRRSASHQGLPFERTVARSWLPRTSTTSGHAW